MLNCIPEINQFSPRNAKPGAIGQLSKIAFVTGICFQEIHINNCGFMDTEEHGAFQYFIKLTQRAGGYNFIQT